MYLYTTFYKKFSKTILKRYLLLVKKILSKYIGNSLPGRESQLVRVLSQCTKVRGLVPGQGTYKKQPMNVEQQITVLSFSLPLPVLKSINNFLHKNSLRNYKVVEKNIVLYSMFRTLV